MSSRVITNANKTSSRIARLAVPVVGVMLTLAACNGTSTPETLAPTTSNTSTTLPATTTAPPPSTTTEPVPETSEYEAVWVSAWAAAADPTSTRADLDEVASEEAATRLDEMITGSAERTITNYPVISEPDADGFVEINDCLLSQPPFFDSGDGWYRGRVGPNFEGVIQVETVESVSTTGCVPAELAEAAIADYEDYVDAYVEIFQPPDPSSPRTAETMTGVRLENTQAMVAQFAENGWELRSRPETHPEVIEWRSPTELVISDCQLTDPERGVYVTATGERTDEIPAIVEGQRDAVSVEILLEDGRWKVAEQRGSREVDCEFAPTGLGLPLVGGSGT